jgi:hypothetical protein
MANEKTIMNIPLDELPHFLKRAQKDWELIAGETLDVEYVKGTLYGYGSELACLRLEHKYRNPKARAFYSKNLNTWTFALD